MKLLEAFSRTLTILFLFLFIQCTNESLYDKIQNDDLNFSDLDYLDIENDCFTEFSENDWRSFIEAKERMNIFMSHNHCSIVR